MLSIGLPLRWIRMIKFFKTSKLIYVFALLALSFSYTSNLEAQDSSKPKKQVKYKKARALQSSTAKKWQRSTKHWK